MMKKLLVLLLLSAGYLKSQEVKDGDIVFIVNPSGQGKAIQMATKSKFTHVGIVFIENGKPMVYHAVEPVSVNTLDEFRAMSTDGRVEVKRLKDQSAVTPSRLIEMKAEAKSLLGKHYDIFFAWDDKELYCSEYVWKLYKKHLGLEIGALRPLRDFDLSAPAVKEIMKQRYGNAIPYDEKMISPGDMYSSELLQ